MSFARALILLVTVICFHSAGSAAERKSVLLIGQGPDGHPPTTHEYMAGQQVLSKCLAGVPDLDVTVVQADGPWPQGPELIRGADAVVLFVSQGAKWVQDDARRLDALATLASRGGGLLSLHWAMGTRDAGPIENYLKLLGGCHGGPDRKYQVVESELKVADRTSPITRGVENLRVQDEFYYRLKFVKPAGSVKPVLKTEIDGQAETVAWSWERPDGGRSFGFSGLHFHANWRHEAYRRTVTQAVLWVLKVPIPADGVDVTSAGQGIPPARP